MIDKITELLGSEADSLLNYKAKFPKEQLNLPGPNFVNEILVQSDRTVNVEKSKLDFKQGEIRRNWIRFNLTC